MLLLFLPAATQKQITTITIEMTCDYSKYQISWSRRSIDHETHIRHSSDSIS